MTEAKQMAGHIAAGTAAGIAVSAYGVALPQFLPNPRHDAMLKGGVGAALALIAIKWPGYYRALAVGAGTGLIVTAVREYRGA